MDFWIYVYIIVAILVIIGIWTLYTQGRYSLGSTNTTQNNYNFENAQEIFKLEILRYCLLRSYAMEIYNESECSKETIECYKDTCLKILDAWSKITRKEHFSIILDYLRNRFNLHLRIVEELGNECLEELSKLRIINRKLSETHENWWGLKFQSTEYMRNLNEIDELIRSMVAEVYDENHEEHYNHFEDILQCHWNKEQIIKQLFSLIIP